MAKRLFIVVVVLLFIAVQGVANNAEEGKKMAKSPYVGLWKLEEIANPGEKWKKAQYPFTMQISPDGSFVVLMPLSKIRITGTYKILDDGRLQISEEAEDGEPIQPPSISEYSIQNGKLITKANQSGGKKHLGFILKKVGE